jgi:hypothetical protein
MLELNTKELVCDFRSNISHIEWGTRHYSRGKKMFEGFSWIRIV